MATLLDYTRWYAANGYHILPLKPNSKEPATPHAFYDAVPNSSAWETGTAYNIGIAIKASGICVVDVDVQNGGRLDSLTEYYGKGILDTVRTTTGSGGNHLIYRAPDGVELAKRSGVKRGKDGQAHAGPLGMGIDFLPIGYIVAPPSVHPNGSIYRFDEGHAAWEIDIAPLPSAILAAVRSLSHTPRPVPVAYDPAFINKLPSKPTWLLDEARAGASDGGRHNAIISFAYRCVEQCPRESDALELIEQFARNCTPALSAKDVADVWYNARRHTRFIPPVPKDRPYYPTVDRSKPCI